MLIYRYILFKDGRPWKGVFDEVDFMNQYSQAFDDTLKEVLRRKWRGKNDYLFAVRRFFKRIQPATWDYANKCYKSLMREYVVGANADEAGVVLNINYEELPTASKEQFRIWEQWFRTHLKNLNAAKDFAPPKFGVTKGSNYLTEL